MFTAGNQEKVHILKIIVTDGTSHVEQNWTIFVHETSLPQINRTCNELGGIICASQQICSGSILSASDSNFCCSAICNDISPPVNTTDNINNSASALDRCVNNVTGRLEIKINNPDNGDEFFPLEEMEIEVEVKNDNDEDKDVVVEATLFDIDEDERIKKIKSDDVEINEDDEEDITLTLKVPNGELDEDHDYILFVKAFEEGHEREQCAEDDLDIEIDRKSQDVVIEDFEINSNIVACSSSLTTETSVTNIGEDTEEDVTIEIRLEGTELIEESGPFDLEDHDDDEGTLTKTVSLSIPKTVKSGTYSLTSTVFFDDGDQKTSVSLPLTVQTCTNDNEQEIIDIVPPAIVFEKQAGEFIEVPVLLKNDDNIVKEYTVVLTDSGVIETNSINVLLAGNSERDIAISAKVKNDIVSGTYPAQIRVFDHGEIIERRDVVVEVPEKKQTRSWSLQLFFVNIVLLSLVLFLLKLFYVRR